MATELTAEAAREARAAAEKALREYCDANPNEVVIEYTGRDGIVRQVMGKDVLTVVLR